MAENSENKPVTEDVTTGPVSMVQQAQAVHRRILAAKDAGEDPDSADLEFAAAYNALPYAGFDRVSARDDD